MAVYPKQAGKVYEKIFFRLSQPIDSIGIRFSAGIAAREVQQILVTAYGEVYSLIFAD